MHYGRHLFISERGNIAKALPKSMQGSDLVSSLPEFSLSEIDYFNRTALLPVITC